MDRDCKNCIYARTPDDPFNNGCTAWDCEYINRKEAIAVWKEYIEEYRESIKENDMGLCDFYVKDKSNGHIHKVGTDRHDSIWVDFEGTLHYQNIQNGDGCSYKSAKDNLQGYEFVPSDCGVIETIKPFGGE